MVLLIVVVFPVVFVGMWMLVCLILGQVSGWARLAARYAVAEPDRGTSLLTSGRVGFVNYNNALRVGADECALHLSVLKLFAVGHRPLAIPWSAVRISAQKTLFFKWVRFEISEGPTVRVALSGVRSLAHRGKVPEALRAVVGELS